MNLRLLNLGAVFGLIVGGCTPVSPVAAVEMDSGQWPSAGVVGDALTGVVQVVAGGSATCALDGEGAVYCWGLFTYGTFEDPPVPLFGLPATRPVRLGGPVATRVTAYPRGLGMLDAAGSVFAAGRLEPRGRELRVFERLGGDDVQRVFGGRATATPRCWLQSDGVAECDSGTRHPVPSGVLLDERAPSCFAHGNAVQCGHESQSFADVLDATCTDELEERSVFRVDVGFRPAALYSAPQGVCALSKEGALECIQRERLPTACGGLPRSGPPRTTHRLIRKTWVGPFTDVSLRGVSGARGYGLRPDGVVVDLDEGTPVLGAADIVQLTASVGHTCGLTKDGRVSCWGNNEDGQLGNGSQGRRSAETSRRAAFVLSAKSATRIFSNSARTRSRVLSVSGPATTVNRTWAASIPNQVDQVWTSLDSTNGLWTTFRALDSDRLIALRIPSPSPSPSANGVPSCAAVLSHPVCQSADVQTEAHSSSHNCAAR